MSGGTEAEPSLRPALAPERSRRELLAGGGVLGAALLATGCTSKVRQASNIEFDAHTPGATHDVAVLNELLRLEYQSIYTYTASIQLLPQPAPPPKKKPKPKPPPSKPPNPNAPQPPLELMVPLAYAAAQQFLAQELSHVTELSLLVQQANRHPVKPSPSYELGAPRSKQDILMLLHRTEVAVLQGYLKRITRFTLPGLRGAAAAILANHAQHSAVLRLQLGLDPIPEAIMSTAE